MNVRARRFVSAAFVLAFLQFPAFAAGLERMPSTGQSVADLVERLHSHIAARKLSVVTVESEASSFVIPAAGSLAGGGGTFFRSDVTIANRRSAAQRISVAWFARGVNNGSASVQTFTIPANTTTMERDFVASVLGKSGLGSILVVGIDAAGNVDSGAVLDGFSRIWTPQPGSSGTVSQEFGSFDVNDTLATSYGYGLRQDSGFRANVGFVNLFSTPNTYTIDLVGTGGQTQFTQNVQAYSMEQVPVPAGNWGDFYIRVSSAPTNFNFWSAYGVSVDNTTGDGWVTHVH
ncbi:MAG TPA: hypothetical protein VF698_13440, partial [Thermoanaerobaculia bacterium]